MMTTMIIMIMMFDDICFHIHTRACDDVTIIVWMGNWFSIKVALLLMLFLILLFLFFSMQKIKRKQNAVDVMCWLNLCLFSFFWASMPKTGACVRRSKNAKMMFTFPSEYFVRPKASSNFISLHFDNFIRSVLCVRLLLSAGPGVSVRACGCLSMSLLCASVYVCVCEWMNKWMWVCLVSIFRSNLLKLSSLLTLPSDVNNLKNRKTKYFIKFLTYTLFYVCKNQQETVFISIITNEKVVLCIEQY